MLERYLYHPGPPAARAALLAGAQAYTPRPGEWGVSAERGYMGRANICGIFRVKRRIIPCGTRTHLSCGFDKDPSRNGGARGQNRGKSAWLYKYRGGYIIFFYFLLQDRN